MKIIYVNCGVKKLFWRKSIAVIYATFAVAKRKPEKNSGLYRIRIRAREPLGCFFTLSKLVPRLIRMLVSNRAQKLFLCPVNRRPEYIAMLYLPAMQTRLFPVYRVSGSSRKVFFAKSFPWKWGPKSQRNSTILQHVSETKQNEKYTNRSNQTVDWSQRHS